MPTQQHFVYRLYDATGQTLYVGYTKNIKHRLSSHARRAWWKDVAKKVIDTYGNAKEAITREAEAILRESPLYASCVATGVHVYGFAHAYNPFGWEDFTALSIAQIKTHARQQKARIRELEYHLALQAGALYLNGWELPKLISMSGRPTVAIEPFYLAPDEEVLDAAKEQPEKLADQIWDMRAEKKLIRRSMRSAMRELATRVGIEQAEVAYRGMAELDWAIRSILQVEEHPEHVCRFPEIPDFPNQAIPPARLQHVFAAGLRW